ncbi:PilZ domain-containing protein, partial [Acidobacteria bacterium AH-259-A15]|nr:PilZ domain-containing protein [Acidobacteria bacterium AH-259-A15]
MKERRGFKRWTVSIPCTVEWKDRRMTGKITNISLGGALITQVKAFPPEGASITIIIQAQQEDVVLKGRIMSNVIHTIWEDIEDVGIGSFGVKFGESPQKVREKLIPVIRALISREDYLKNY